MSPRLIPIGLALVAVAAAVHYLASPSEAPSSPDRARHRRSAGAAAGRPASVQRTLPGVGLGNPAGEAPAPVQRPGLAPQNAPARTFVAAPLTAGPAEAARADVGVRVRAPEGGAWVVADNQGLFLTPGAGKIVEMHRTGRPDDPRFATVYLYAVPVGGSTDGAAEVREMERLDTAARRSGFRVEDERPITVGAQPMTRRVTLWDAGERATRFLSVRCVRDGKLYVLLAFTDPSRFDELLPEFESIVNSLRVDGQASDVEFQAPGLSSAGRRMRHAGRWPPQATKEFAMAQKWKTLDDVFVFALGEEQKAAALYHAFADQAPSPKVKALFEKMVAEETGHFKKLIRVRKASEAWFESSGLRRLPRPQAPELDAAGITDVESAYRFAIRSEGGALEFYATLAQMADDPKIQRAFSDLAEEEETHMNALREDLAKRHGTRAFLKKAFSFAFTS